MGEVAYKPSKDVAYEPSKWGAEFHALPYDEALGAGAAGPGKTTVLTAEPLQQIYIEHERCVNREHAHPLDWGSSVGWVLYLRRNANTLDQTIARTHRLYPVVDRGATFLSKDKTWMFSSGLRVQFGHCATRYDWEQYLSNEYTMLLFDELVEFEEEQYDQIGSRLRTSDPVLRKYLKTRAMSNPVMTQGGAKNRNPYWVRDKFVKPWPQGRKVIKTPIRGIDNTIIGYNTVIYLPATLRDNPSPSFVADYERKLASRKKHIRDALLFGNWWLTVNSYYGDVWSDHLNTCSPFHVPDDWTVFRSMDWGFKTHGCIHWWAMDEDGNLYCIRELTFQEKTDVQVAEMVKTIEEKMGYWDIGGSRLTGPADTQLWEERGEAYTKTKAQTFAEKGVPWVPADKRRRKRNAELIYKRLGDHRGGTTSAGLVFFRGCVEAIQNIKAIETDPDDPDAPADTDHDHWHDSVCYAAAYASNGRIGSTRLPSEDEDEEEEARARGRGRFGYG